MPKNDDVPQDRNYILWNRGEWRGWAVAHIEKTGLLIETLVHYATKRLHFVDFEFRKDVALGRVFLVDPDEVLEFIAVQLTRLDDPPKNVIKTLINCAEALRIWKDSQEE